MKLDSSALSQTISTKAQETPRQMQILAWIVSLSWLMVLGLFWTTTVSMIAMWHHSSTFTHGYLVLPLVCYLIKARWQHLASLPLHPNLWGLLILGGLGFGWLLGHLADVLIVQQVALVGMLQSIVLTVAGVPITRALLFPLGFLYFAVPFGDGLIPLLQDITAEFTVIGLQLSGVPVFHDGWLLTIPSGTWHVAEACSGIRYFLASLMVGCLYAYVAYHSWRYRLGFILLSLIVPIFANGMRAYGIVLTAHLTDNRIAVGVDHIVAGWVFFGIVTFLLFWIGSCWREPATSDEETLLSVSHLSQEKITSTDPSPSTWRIAFAAVQSVGVLALTPLTAHALSLSSRQAVILQAMAPQVASPWQALAEYGGWAPHFPGTAAQVLQSYTANGRDIHLSILFYTNQDQGAEIVNSANDITGSKEWIRASESVTQVEVDAQPLNVKEAVYTSSRGKRLVWSWYWIDGQFTTSSLFAKLLQTRTRLFGASEAAAVIVVSTDLTGGHDEATRRLQDFLRHVPSLQATLESFSR